MARLTRNGWISEAGRTPEQADEAERRLVDWYSTSNSHRRAKNRRLTLEDDVWEALEALQPAWGGSRSEVVSRIVRAVRDEQLKKK